MHLCLLLFFIGLLRFVAIKKACSFIDIGILPLTGARSRDFFTTFMIAGFAVGIVLVGYLALHHPVYVLKMHSFVRIFGVMFWLFFGNLIVATYEEMFCHSWMLVSFKRIFNERIAIFLGALLFGLIHLLKTNFSYLDVFNMMILGGINSLLFFRTGSIWASVGMHCGWNFFIEAMKSRLLYQIIIPVSASGSAHNLLSAICVTLSLSLVFISIRFFLYRYPRWNGETAYLGENFV
jgi:membrane protease YdiL (CAAX protease family)